MSGGRHEGRELSDRHLETGHVERRHVDGPVRCGIRVVLDVEREGVGGWIATHEEPSRGDLHEA